ncbi:MAG: leucine-rich repeat domain-containing protein, partial [Bacilli bacterium]|nr:leucine-rich repeat domain-containing protein [Bacilli bacterium]
MPQSIKKIYDSYPEIFDSGERLRNAVPDFLENSKGIASVLGTLVDRQIFVRIKNGQIKNKEQLIYEIDSIYEETFIAKPFIYDGFCMLGECVNVDFRQYDLFNEKKEAPKPTPQQVSKPAPQQVSKPAPKQVTKPAPQPAPKPVSKNSPGNATDPNDLLFSSVTGGYKVVGPKNKGIKTLIIPSTYNGRPVIEIGEKAFRGDNFYSFSTLEKVVIPGSVKKIGAYAFNNNFSLTDVTIEDGVEEIVEYAFWGCKFKEVYVPSSVKKIGHCAFAGYSIPTLLINCGASSAPAGWNQQIAYTKKDSSNYAVTTVVFLGTGPVSKPVSKNSPGNATDPNDLLFSSVTGGYKVVGPKNRGIKTLIIPSTYNGRPVIEI